MKPITVNIEPDDSPEDPSEWAGWRMYSFSDRHGSYKDPEKLGLSLSQGPDGIPIIQNPGLRQKLDVGLAFWLSYYEHGSCVWALLDQAPKCRFDGTRIAGLLIWSQKPEDMGAKTYETRTKDAEGFLKTYTNYCNGEVYGYRVDDPEGKIEDAGCWGFYELDHMFREIKETTGNREVVFGGRASDLAQYYWPLRKPKTGEPCYPGTSTLVKGKV